MSKTDPIFHRDAEERFYAHVERLLEEDRLKVDSLRGRVSTAGTSRKTVIAIKRDDRAVDIKRMMIELNKPDRDLQERMPKGQLLDLEIKRRRFLMFPKTIGRFKAVSVSPTRALLDGSRFGPLSKGAVEEVIRKFASTDAAPTTLAILSTAGFTADAKSLVESADSRVVLVEPNDAGGFSVFSPRSIDKELFDPEADDDKRRRVRDAVEEGRLDLSGSGLAADKIVAKTQLPAQLVEAELRSYAKENPGLAAKRLDGRMVLFREGSAVMQLTPAGGVPAMPMIDKIRALFARRGETEKKIAFLSERRAALGQQRDRAYEEIASLETKDGELREQFKSAGPELVKRRITSQLLQLRKDMERRQQLLGVLNQQMNVVSTHLHNLELVQQGETAKLPDSEEMATDAAAAEEMLATLQESSEMAATVGGVASSGMTDEEQALYEELLRDTGAPTDSIKEPAKGVSIAGASQTPAGQRIIPPIMPTPEREREKRKSEPEAG